ncbi:MAG: amidohydrolase family protein [Proteobacteria bacterium]|nr:amidohydrolase family protein [Pseudomonadota bacterium]
MAIERRYARLISSDSHVTEPADLWLNALGGKFGERAPRMVGEREGRQGKYFDVGGGLYVVMEKIEAEAKKNRPGTRDAGSDQEVRLQFQRDAGLDAEIINPTTMGCIMQSPDLEIRTASAAVYNDYMAEYCAPDTNRLIGIAVVPTHDVDWAVNELQRVRKLGFRGAMINTVPPEGQAPYRDKRYEKIWAAAEELDIPLTLHILTGRVLDPISYAETDEEYAEAPGKFLDAYDEIRHVLANDFIFGQIFDKFPKLKLVTGELELVWVLPFVNRIDQMQTDFSDVIKMPALKHRASDYMRIHVWHGMIDDSARDIIIPIVGANRVTWGSDFPHIRSIGLDAHQRTAEMFGSLSAADQARIVGGNVAELYHLN